MSINTFLVAGHAKLPQGIAAQNVYESLTITVEVDKKYGVIVEASCTLATQHGRDFIGRLLRGLSLQDGIEPALDLIQAHYHGRATNALTASLKDLYVHYVRLQADSRS